MMRRTVSPGDPCERARAWISLDVDGEISQLERALLEAHVAGCERCATTAAELRAVSEALRSAPLEQPETPVALPARPRRSRTVAARLALAATLAALAAGLGIVAGSIGDGGDQAPPPTSDIALLPSSSSDDVRDNRRLRPRDSGPDDAVPPRLGAV